MDEKNKKKTGPNICADGLRREYGADLNGSIEWLKDTIDSTRFGEVAITVRVHKGREMIIERQFTEKVKSIETRVTE